jgi:hypothetical protein
VCSLDAECIRLWKAFHGVRWSVYVCMCVCVCMCVLSMQSAYDCGKPFMGSVGVCIAVALSTLTLHKNAIFIKQKTEISQFRRGASKLFVCHGTCGMVWNRKRKDFEGVELGEECDRTIRGF